MTVLFFIIFGICSVFFTICVLNTWDKFDKCMDKYLKESK